MSASCLNNVRNLHLILAFAIISVSLAEGIYLATHKDPVQQWCEDFAAAYADVDLISLPICTYQLEKISAYDSTNHYFCYASETGDSHFERDTVTPFYHYEGWDPAGDMLLKTAFPNEKMTEYRVIVLGDSVSEGNGVGQNNSYYLKLEENLKGEGYDVEILNGAHGCSSIRDYYYILNKTIGNFEFDHLILGISANDFGPCWEAILIKDRYGSEFPDGIGPAEKEEALVDACLIRRTPAFLPMGLHAPLSRLQLYRMFMVDISHGQSSPDVVAGQKDLEVEYADRLFDLIDDNKPICHSDAFSRP
jgi:hypothetical protein